jgi:hypothetical protein
MEDTRGAHRRARPVTIALQGQFPRSARSARLNLVDSQWLVSQAVRLLWQELGGHWGPQATVREGRTPEGTQVVALHRDAPLADAAQHAQAPTTSWRGWSSCAWAANRSSSKPRGPVHRPRSHPTPAKRRAGGARLDAGA